MNLLNRSDLTNKPLFKYITIALVVVNAFVLAFLLFGPGRGSTAQASTPSGDPAAVQEGSGTEGNEGNADDGEEPDYEDGESENSDEAYTSEESPDADDEEGNDFGSGEDEAEESGPILELTDDHVTLKVGDYFNFYDYIKTMKDRDGSELSRYIHLAGEVNTYQPGDYTITYQITSPIDGKTASKDLLVTVEY
jgi:hypothetical protein